jgi:hypothetical protein
MTVNTLPTSAEITSAGQQNADQKVDFASTWDFLIQKLGTKSGQGPETVASAASVDLDAVVETRDIVISGAVAITGFVVEAGKVFRVRASGASTLTNNSAIVTQRGANIVCAAGDTFILRATATDTVEVMNYVLAAGIAPASVTPAMLTQPFVAGTAVAGAAQTEVAFAVASYAKRFTVSLVNFSTNGTARPIIQLGDAGGYETTGYAGNTGYRGAVSDFLTTFVGLNHSGLLFATAILNGHITFTLHDAATNTWTYRGGFSITGPGTENICIDGSKALSAALTGFRITTSGSDTIDVGGSMNVIYD